MAEWGRWQEPTIMRKYPHLLALDALIWTEYLTVRNHQIRRVQYDLWVGSVVAWPEGVNPVPRQAAATTAKRVDAVFEDDRQRINVCEIKPYGNYVAYGQVIMYGRLIDALGLNLGPLKLHIICSEADPDILPLADAAGIDVAQVGPVVPGLPL